MRNKYVRGGRKTELLAPAGDFESLKAVISNGADSVYLGSTLFNARKRADNFSGSKLVEAIDYAHLRSVSVYLTLNVLIADDELETAYLTAKRAWEAGVDAVIVQDLGFASLLKRRMPDIEIHASTQATIYDEAAIEACAEIGFSRIILPRELSLPEISYLTGFASDLGIQTEVFVHGALCVGYSGQCLLSSSAGGRSGNRGECAQPCRLGLTLLKEDGETEKEYSRLSLKDLSLIDHLDEITAAGVTALKIEGRARSAEYAGIVTAQYRKALDRTPYSKETLELAFNRGGGFTTAYFTGEKSEKKMSGGHPGSHGVYVGRVSAVNPMLGIVDVQVENKNLPEKGDILSIRREGEKEQICSAPAGPVEKTSRGIRAKGFHPDVIEKIFENDMLFRMSSIKDIKEAQNAKDPGTPIKGTLKSDLSGLGLEWEITDGIAKGIKVKYSLPFEGTDHPVIPEERVMSQLSKTGGTPFRVNHINVEDLPCVPVSFINKLRRESLEELSKELIQSFRRNVTPIIEKGIPEINTKVNGSLPPLISAYLYEWNGTYEALDLDADVYELPFRNFIDEKALEAIRKLKQESPDTKVAVALPPAVTGKEKIILEKILKKAFDAGADMLLSGDPGISIMADKYGIEIMVDRSANIFNSESLKLAFSSGPFSVALSAELSMKQIENILDKVSLTPRLEIPVYGRERIMYTEHCPVGYNIKGCRKCENGTRFSLRSPISGDMPVICHPGPCTAEILSPYLLSVPEEMVKINGNTGIIARISFTDESKETRRNIVSSMRRILNGESPDKRYKGYVIQEERRQSTYSSRGYYERGIF